MKSISLVFTPATRTRFIRSELEQSRNSQFHSWSRSCGQTAGRCTRCSEKVKVRYLACSFLYCSRAAVSDCYVKTCTWDVVRARRRRARNPHRPCADGKDLNRVELETHTHSIKMYASTFWRWSLVDIILRTKQHAYLSMPNIVLSIKVKSAQVWAQTLQPFHYRSCKH